MIIKDDYITPNFKVSEIACNDQYQNVLINSAVISHANRLQRFREWYNRAMLINSWYRTPEYNKQVNGEDGSFHLRAIATDVALPDEYKTFTKVRKQEFLNNIKAKWYAICKEDGVNGGVGFYDTFFHLDSGNADHERFWDERSER